MTPEDSSNIQLAILWASVGNTIPTVFWVMHYLCANPSLKIRILHELRDVLESTVNYKLEDGQTSLSPSVLQHVNMDVMKELYVCKYIHHLYILIDKCSYYHIYPLSY
jgi:hypothetical protein